MSCTGRKQLPWRGAATHPGRCFPLVLVGEVKFLLDLVQELLQTGLLLFPRVILAQEDVRSPVCRVEAPVASPVLLRLVTVHHELMGRVHESAVHALDARCVGAGVQLRHDQALALAEALVVDFEAPLGELQLQRAAAAQLLLAARRVGASVDQGVAEPLGVRLGDEAAGRRREGQDPHDFEDLQLVRRAPGAVDVQLVAHRVDLLEAEVPQHRVEDLRQAQSLLSADHEARDGLGFQHRLAPLRGAVRRDEQRARHHGRRQMLQNRLGLLPVLLEEELMLPPGRESRRSAQRAHRAEVKLLESLLQSRMRLEALPTYCLHVFPATLEAQVLLVVDRNHEFQSVPEPGKSTESQNWPQCRSASSNIQ